MVWAEGKGKRAVAAVAARWEAHRNVSDWSWGFLAVFDDQDLRTGDQDLRMETLTNLPAVCLTLLDKSKNALF